MGGGLLTGTCSLHPACLPACLSALPCLPLLAATVVWAGCGSIVVVVGCSLSSNELVSNQPLHNIQTSDLTIISISLITTLHTTSHYPHSRAILHCTHSSQPIIPWITHTSHYQRKLWARALLSSPAHIASEPDGVRTPPRAVGYSKAFFVARLLPVAVASSRQ